MPEVSLVDCTESQTLRQMNKVKEVIMAKTETEKNRDEGHVTQLADSCGRCLLPVAGKKTTIWPTFQEMGGPVWRQATQDRMTWNHR